MELSPFQQHLVLSCFQSGAQIGTAIPMQAMQPCPLLVSVVVPGDTQIHCVVLRLSRNRGGVEREALVLPLLHALGLPVPRLLAGPAGDPEIPDSEPVSALEFLPGRTLQALSDESGAGIAVARRLLAEGIQRLFAQTTAVADSSAGPLLPRRTLVVEWEEQRDHARAWETISAYQEALRRLEIPCRVATKETPLVFFNGDYQPGNFLTDGAQITGFLDFEKACFEDPLWTLARYPVYQLEPLDSAGVAATVRESLGFTEAQFALRVALFALRTLRTKTHPAGFEKAALRERVLLLLNRSLRTIER